MEINIKFGKKDLWYILQLFLSTGTNIFQGNTVLELKEERQQQNINYKSLSLALKTVLFELEELEKKNFTLSPMELRSKVKTDFRRLNLPEDFIKSLEKPLEETKE